VIDREQVADLQPGDVVELTRDEWPAGSAVRGPLRASDGIENALYLLDGFFGVRNPQGEPYEPNGTLTVVSRAPRPLYVNHPRTEPVQGDVVRDADSDEPGIWVRARLDFGAPWYGSGTSARSRAELPARLRLLVDGETGQVVP
jgi:hypothetical protein